MKRLVSAFLAGAMALSLAACGGAASTSTVASSAASGSAAASAAETAAGDLDYIKEKGKMVIGYTVYEPMNYTDADGNEAEYDIVYDASTGVWSVKQMTETYVFDRYASPNKEHWLGTDTNGMDMLTRLMYGGRVSLIIGFIVVAVIIIFSFLMSFRKRRRGKYYSDYDDTYHGGFGGGFSGGGFSGGSSGGGFSGGGGSFGGGGSSRGF